MPTAATTAVKTAVASATMAPTEHASRLPLPEIGPKWPPWEPLTGSFIKAVVVEFICTTAFLFITIGHVTFSCHASDVGQGNGVTGGDVGDPTSCLLTEARVLSIATVFGLTIGVLVYASASFSGAHLNPAITMGCLCTKKITAQRAVCYWAAQITGAILGSLFPYLIDRQAWHAAKGGTNSNTAVPGMHDSAVWAMEALLTAVLVFVVFAATDARRASLEAHIPVLAPFAIGFTVFVCHLVAVPIDGCSINPARSFGPAVISGIWTDQWIFWVGPLSGAMASSWRGALLMPIDKQRHVSAGPMSANQVQPAHGHAPQRDLTCTAGGIFGALVYEVFFRLSRDQDDGKGQDGDTSPQPPHDEEAAKHLADFSGFVGHKNHDQPGTDEMLLPPYGGLQGAGSGRHHARPAVHPVVTQAPAPHPAAVPDAVSAQPLQQRPTSEPTPHSFRGRATPPPPPSIASV